MMTWSDYFALKLYGALLSLMVVVVLEGIRRSQADCPQCGRKMHFRWRRPHPLAPRRFCAFHDWEQP